MNLYYITVCIGVNNKLLVLVLVLVLVKVMPMYDCNVTIDCYLCNECHCSLPQLLRLASKIKELELIEELLHKQDFTNVAGTITHYLGNVSVISQFVARSKSSLTSFYRNSFLFLAFEVEQVFYIFRVDSEMS